ncbi:MAG: flagellar biosynthetic protein FliR [Rhizomicrobium sp.]
MTVLTDWIVSCLLLGLRIAPVFALAPPFSLVRMPRLFLMLLGLGLSICLVSAYPAETALADMSLHGIVVAAVRELLLGSLFLLAFHLVFGALYLAGRTIDIQSGYGFAVLVDPTSQQQTPLVGSLFAYAMGGVFFAAGGHIGLLRVLAASLRAVPLGGWTLPGSLDRLAAFISMVMLIAFGVAGGAILVLFLVDLAIALMSRTIPQMNVLILGFQVKTIVLFLALPASFGVAGALFLRLTAVLLDSLPRLV